MALVGGTAAGMKMDYGLGAGKRKRSGLGVSFIQQLASFKEDIVV
jgi:hypothetical protein